MSWAYVRDSASNNKRLWHHVAYWEVTASPRQEPLVKDGGYTDVEQRTHP